jgi:DNA-binding MarR family transcriptional regulator
VVEWAPECTEDELLVALFAVKRGLVARSGSVDPGAFPVLHHLAAGGPSRQGALAESLGLDASTISRHVRTLAADGMVDSARDPEDGRAAVLSIAEPGRRFLADHLRSRRATLSEATAHFTPEERAELVRLLNKLAAGLGEPKES